MAAIEFPDTTAQVRRLPNGLELIVKEDQSAPVVSMQAWCRTGSIHEGSWLGAGMAHFVEHMLFKGTDKRNSSEIAEAVQSVGAYINAYTSFDRTVYWIDAPSDGTELCLDVLCDMVCGSLFPEEEFVKEQEVIRREFAMGDDNPSQVLSKQLLETVFRVHPCRHPVIGHLDVFNRQTRDDLFEFYQREYSPDNVFYVVVGNIDAEKVEDQLAAAYENMPRGSRPAIPLPGEPKQLGRRERHEEFETDLSRMRMGWQIPDRSHPDASALDVLAMMLGQGQSSRFYRRIREDLGLAHSISTSSYHMANTGLFIVAADSAAEKREEVRSEVLKGFEEVRQGGVSQEELNKAVRMLLSHQFSTLMTMSGMASDLASNWLVADNLDYTRDYICCLQAVTTEEVSGVAERYFTDEAMSVVSLNPSGKCPAHGFGKTSAATKEVKKVELDNGLTLLVKSDARVPVVNLSAVFRGGVLAETKENNGINQLISRLLTGDTANHSAAEVAEMIESVGGSIGASSGNNSIGVAAEVMRPDLDLAMDLLGDALLCPVFLPEAVDREKGFQVATIKAEEDRPMSVAMKRMRQELFGQHPYSMRSAGSEQSVMSLDGDALEQFRSPIICGNNGVLTVFGDIDEDEAIQVVKEKLMDMPAGKQAFKDRSAGKITSPGAREIAMTHDKSQAILVAGFRSCSLAHEDRDALDLLHEACCDMSSRLFVKIREELGLAYSVGSSQLLGLDPGCFLFYAATSPEKLGQVQEVLLKEVAQIREEGLSPEELERAKKSLVGKEVIRLQGMREQASVSGLDELLGLGWDHYQKTAGKVESLTNDDICRVASTYFKDEERIVVRLTAE